MNEKTELSDEQIKKAVGASDEYWATSKLFIIGIARAIEDELRAASPSSKSTTEADAHEQKLWLNELFTLIEKWNSTRDGTPSKAEAWNALWKHSRNIGPHWRAREYLASSSIKEDGERAEEPSSQAELVMREARRWSRGEIGNEQFRGYVEGIIECQPSAGLLEAVDTILETAPCDCSDKRRYEKGEHLSHCYLFDLNHARNEFAICSSSSPPSPLGDTPDQQEQRNA